MAHTTQSIEVSDRVDRPSSNGKILVAIQSYSATNEQHLARMIREYKSMASFDVDIVVFSNAPKQLDEGVEVIVLKGGRNPWIWPRNAVTGRSLRSLREDYNDWKRQMRLSPFPHKQLFAERLNGYDFFIYSEDDMLVTERNLRAFIEVSAKLQENEIPGFLRYEERPGGGHNYPEIHGHYHWDPATVHRHGEYTLAFFTNEHAACYVLTQKQLQKAIDSGGFLVGPHKGKYDPLCTAATDPYTQCGFQKVVCISHMEDFLIHHLPNKYVGTHFGIDEREFRRQLDLLVNLGASGQKAVSLFETETKLREGSYSKSYYEPIFEDVLAAIPAGAKTILSVGCGWGATEAELARKGFKVTAIPVDPLIPGGAMAASVEIVAGSFDQALRQLRGRQFDVLLILNVLHLVSNPTDTLSQLKAFLTTEGTLIALVPNTAKKHKYADAYRRTRMHLVSQSSVRDWFRQSGLKVAELKNILGPKAQKIARLSRGLVDSWLAYEFLVVAKPK
jgi:2-polyprenyl-3-methyl-5-hydroxy-6-metoxy-1,4-benzoquinol methylase